MRAARSTGASESFWFLSFFATLELCTLGQHAGSGEEERRSTLAEGRVNSSNDIVAALSLINILLVGVGLAIALRYGVKLRD